jgi:hypothetical protein
VVVDPHQLAREVLNDRERVVYEAWIAGESMSMIARKLGLGPTAARDLAETARRKLEAAYAAAEPMTVTYTSSKDR